MQEDNPLIVDHVLQCPIGMPVPDWQDMLMRAVRNRRIPHLLSFSFDTQGRVELCLLRAGGLDVATSLSNSLEEIARFYAEAQTASVGQCLLSERAEHEETAFKPESASAIHRDSAMSALSSG
jgi:hypothetical protein